MIRTAVIPVLLALICARQAAGAPDGPDAQGTRGGLSAHFQNEASLRSNLRAEPERYRRRRKISRLPAEPRAPDGRKSVKYPSSTVVRSGAAEQMFAELLERLRHKHLLLQVVDRHHLREPW